MEEEIGISTESRKMRLTQTRDIHLQRRKDRFLLSNQNYSQEYQSLTDERNNRHQQQHQQQQANISSGTAPLMPSRKPNGLTFQSNNIPQQKTPPQSTYSLSNVQTSKPAESAEAMHSRLMELGQKAEGNQKTANTNTSSVPNPLIDPLASSALMSAGARVVASTNGGSIALDLSNTHDFAMNPVPKGALVQCYITRLKGGLKNMFSTSYECYLQLDDTFLIAAKRGSSAAFAFTTEKKKFEKTHDAFLGKLKSNFVGTEFTLYDTGLNPSKTDGKSDPSQLRRELSVVTYEANVLSSKGPRKMTVMTPVIRPDGSQAVWRPAKAVDGILANYKATCTEQLDVFVNKPPRWNDSVGAYVLNFNGRVTMASVKNFQLVREQGDQVVLQFGKTGKDQFTMDFTWPLSPYQAFAMCISSLDNKLACE